MDGFTVLLWKGIRFIFNSQVFQKGKLHDSPSRVRGNHDSEGRATLGVKLWNHLKKQIRNFFAGEFDLGQGRFRQFGSFRKFRGADFMRSRLGLGGDNE